jgi:hypothetical protein
MRRAVGVFVLLAVLAVAGVLLVGATRKTELAFTLGVTPGGIVTTLAPGEQACQRPIDVPKNGGFDGITVPLGTFHQPGSAVEATVIRLPGRSPLARGTLPAGYPDIGARELERIAVTPAVPEGARIAVCLRNTGTGRVAVYGNGDLASPGSTLFKDSRPATADASLSFTRGSRSVLSEFGVSADHAALFKAGWVGPWTFWLLAALVALGVPALLAFALARAARED